MRFKTSLALATLSTLLLGSSILPSLAQSIDDVPVMRYELKAPIFFGSPSNENPGGGDGPGGIGGNNGSLSISLPPTALDWATVGDGPASTLGGLLIEGGSGTGYVLSNPDGLLPPGLRIQGLGIDGNYSMAGIYDFQLRATDDASSAPANYDAHITVENPLSVGNYPQSVYQATTGVQFTLPAPSTSGGKPPYAFQPLANGMTVDPATGSLSWTPGAAGTSDPFRLDVKDARLRPAHTNDIQVNVSNPLAAAYPQSSYTFRAGVAGSIPAPTVVGGRNPVGSVGGTAPSGMTASLNGSASGTPNAAGQGTLSYSVTDADGRSSVATTNYTVVAALAASVSADTFSWRRGVAITPFAVSATNAISSVDYSVFGNDLPAGVALDTSTGIVSGTPTGTASATTTRFRATETAVGGQIATTPSISYQVTAPVVTVAATQNGETGTAWSVTPNYSNLVAGPNPRTYGLTGAPIGMTINGSGVISWPTPTAGTHNVTVQVNDQDGSWGTASFVLTVVEGVLNGGTVTPAVNGTGSGSSTNPRVLTFTYPNTVFVSRLRAQINGAYKSSTGSPQMTYKLEVGASSSGPWTTVVPQTTMTGSSTATSSTKAVTLGPSSASFTQTEGRWFRLTFGAVTGTTMSGTSAGLGTPEGMSN